MKRKINILAIIAMVFFASCDNYSTPKDTQTAGQITVSIDETYKPVMEEQIKIFEARYPNAKIEASYKPEADCIADFLKDTTRLIFVTRTLSDNEKQQLEAKKIVVSRELSLARDAVAFVVKKGEKSEFTEEKFNEILSGKNKEYTLVFDNKNSSTVRYISDSVLKGKELPSNTYAAKGCQDVINYVSKTPKAIGVIGVSWIADKTDTATEDFMKSIDVVGVLPYNDSLLRYRKPYQAYIGLKEYPYCRELFFISKETWVGLGTGFANYLGKDGQMVFSKSRLFPLRVNVYLRKAVAK